MKGLVLLSLCFGSASAFAQVTIFNSANLGNNTATRDAWLTAAGIVNSEVFEDFESYAVGTSMNGAPLLGGLTITDTHASPYATVQSAASFFGTTQPFGNGLAMKENHMYRFDFAVPTQYVGLIDLDDSGSDIRVILTDNSFVDFPNLDGTSGSGQTGEFLGFVSTGAAIARIEYASDGGDGEWGVDSVEYAAVPEPTSMLALGSGLLLLARRRKLK